MNLDHSAYRKPKVSVIVLAYNQAGTIERALNSVVSLREQCPDMEIVVGDDASTDGTREICRQYAVRYPGFVRLLPEQPNMGLVKNYFRALMECKGEYVTDCAGDDLRLSGSCLKDQVDILDGDSALVAVGSDWEIERDGVVTNSSDKKEYSVWRCRIPGHKMLLGVIGATNALPVLLSGVLYRRAAVDALHPMVCNESFGCEDMPVLAWLASRGDFGFVRKSSVRYICGAESISDSSSTLKLLDFYTKAFRCMVALARYYGISPSSVRDAFRSRAAFTVGLAFDSLDAARCRRVDDVLKSWPERPGAVAQAKMLCMKNKFVWKAALWLKRRLVGS